MSQSALPGLGGNRRRFLPRDVAQRIADEASMTLAALVLGAEQDQPTLPSDDRPNTTEEATRSFSMAIPTRPMKDPMPTAKAPKVAAPEHPLWRRAAPETVDLVTMKGTQAEVGRRVRAAARGAGMDLYSLAEHAGMDPCALPGIRGIGAKSLPRTAAQRIADAAGITLAAFVLGIEGDHPVPPFNARSPQRPVAQGTAPPETPAASARSAPRCTAQCSRCGDSSVRAPMERPPVAPPAPDPAPPPTLSTPAASSTVLPATPGRPAVPTPTAQSVADMEAAARWAERRAAVLTPEPPPAGRVYLVTVEGFLEAAVAVLRTTPSMPARCIAEAGAFAARADLFPMPASPLVSFLRHVAEVHRATPAPRPEPMTERAAGTQPADFEPRKGRLADAALAAKRALLVDVLRESRGNMTETARRLGYLSPDSVREAIRRLGVGDEVRALRAEESVA